MSFLDHVSSICAHSDDPPYTATFEHTVPGPARGVLADCLWYPPSLRREFLGADIVTNADAAASSLRKEGNEDAVAATSATPASFYDVAGLDDDTVDTGYAVDDTMPDEERAEIEDGSQLEPRISIMLFIPGNPGIVSFYRGFLDFIHRAHPSLGILAHSHLGHSPRLGRLPPTGAGAISRDAAGLEVQVQATIEVYDALMNEYRDVGGCKVILVGHSIGAWIATQVMIARPDTIDGAFLLFPTLSNMADTVNGARLRVLFLWPTAYILTALSWLIFAVLVPAPITLSLLSWIFPHWPGEQLCVLRGFICSPRSVFSAIRMGRDEMATVRDLTASRRTGRRSGGNIADVLKAEARKVWIYYGSHDDWVPDGAAAEVFKILREGGGAMTRQEIEAEKLKLGKRSRFHKAEGNKKKWTTGVCGEVICGTGVTHDFCINQGAIMGHLCAKWLDDGDFV